MRSFPTGQGNTIQKPDHVAAEAHYFCQRCGLVKAHSVPDEWRPGPEVAAAELRALGQWWSAPGRLHVIQGDGSERVEHRS